MDVICKDDFVVGFVSDLKKYFRKRIVDCLDCHSLNNYWDDDIKEYTEILKAIDEFDDELLIKVYPSVMDNYLVKIYE